MINLFGSDKQAHESLTRNLLPNRVGFKRRLTIVNKRVKAIKRAGVLYQLSLISVDLAIMYVTRERGGSTIVSLGLNASPIQREDCLPCQLCETKKATFGVHPRLTIPIRLTVKQASTLDINSG